MVVTFGVDMQDKVRKVRGLEWATLTDKGLPKPKQKDLTAAQRDGIRFEKKLAKQLVHLAPASVEVLHGQWIAFKDLEGEGLAQPDILLRSGKHLVIIEAKLTQTEVAFEKMHGLYRPLLETVFPTVRQIPCVQACQRVVDDPRSTVAVDMQDLFRLRKGDRYLLHEPML